MKYVIITIIGFTVIFGMTFLICGFIRRKLKKKPGKIQHILISVALGFLLFGIVTGAYLAIHYSADSTALAVFSYSGNVRVSETNDAFFVDGEGEDTAFIFYPGAKVDSEAYLPLMKKLAENGMDCFVLKPPFRMAMLDLNEAEKVILARDYKNVFVGGHSMGGIAASSYASSNPEKIAGVILLASYPVSKISDTTPLLSVYGSEDKVLQMEAYQNARENFPKDYKEIVINGGNHAYFGNYGKQSGDGEAAISQNQQQEDTVHAVMDFMNNHMK